MKIFLVKGFSGYETRWDARAFVHQHAAEEYVVLATAEAKAVVEKYVVFITDEDNVTQQEVHAPCGTNWATVSDPSFSYEGYGPDDFRYRIEEVDLIG